MMKSSAFDSHEHAPGPILYTCALRLLHALALIVALLIGQVQTCRSVYVQADGSVCPTCPESPCVQREVKTGSIVDADCTVCCKLTYCSTDHKSPALRNSSNVIFEVHAVLVATLRPITTPSFIPREVISIHVQNFFANAPPDLHPGRAPPVHLS